MHDTGATAIAKFSKRGAANNPNISTVGAKAAATAEHLLPSEPMVSRESSSGVSSSGRSGATSAGGSKGGRDMDDSRASLETGTIREPSSFAFSATWGSIGGRGPRRREESQGGPALSGRINTDDGMAGPTQGTHMVACFWRGNLHPITPSPAVYTV
jgi:hypothetical protein